MKRDKNIENKRKKKEEENILRKLQQFEYLSLKIGSENTITC